MIDHDNSNLPIVKRKIKHTTIIKKFKSHKRKKFISWLQKYFHYLNSGVYSNVYTNPLVDFVIKITDVPGHLKIPSKDHPLHERFVMPLWMDKSGSMMIQTKVYIPKSGRAREALVTQITKKCVSEYNNTYLDIHSGNVGKLSKSSKKAVIFDY